MDETVGGTCLKSTPSLLLLPPSPTGEGITFLPTSCSSPHMEVEEEEEEGEGGGRKKAGHDTLWW